MGICILRTHQSQVLHDVILSKESHLIAIQVKLLGTVLACGLCACGEASQLAKLLG